MPLRKKIRTGYIITFLLLMTTYFFIFLAIRNSQKENNRLANSYLSVNKIGELRTSIIEAETGIRGFHITKEQFYLKSYFESRNRIPVIYQELRTLEINNPTRLALLDSVKRLIDDRLALIKKNLSLFEASGMQSTPEIDSNRLRGQFILDSIRSISQRYIDSEEMVTADNKNKLSNSFNTSHLVTIISVVVSLFMIFYSLYTYNKESRARDESAKKNIQYQHELERHIEELKKMDAEVRELKSLEKFTATGRIARTIAHEVRNPLTNISLAAEQLQEISKTGDSSMLLELINRNAIRINQLVSDLLNATKAVELSIQKVNINTILDDSLAMAADRIGLGGVSVEKHYADDLCNVAVDEKKIKVAFLNIIVNAIESMEKDKGKLILRTKKDDDKCIIDIEDNGSGMDEDTLQKLFEPYFTSKPKGNGLGLTNCQNIILSHRGKLEVKSKPRKGSVFTVILKTTE